MSIGPSIHHPHQSSQMTTLVHALRIFCTLCVFEACCVIMTLFLNGEQLYNRILRSVGCSCAAWAAAGALFR